MPENAPLTIPFDPASLKDNRAFLVACSMVQRLREHAFDAFLVGGCVRDMVMGKTPSDFDITTSATPEEVQKIFPRCIGVGASFGVMVVAEEGMEFEVATFREERDYEDGRRPESIRYSRTVQEDVSRRDFTVNALLFDPEKNVILDHTGGVDDLKKGILRTVGDAYTRFSEDYLRMLRAVRFSVRLDLEMEEETLSAIRALAGKTRFLSAERIRDELEKILCGKNPHKGFRLLSRLGILKVILPEVEALHGVEQPPEYHPEGDVFVHTMLLLEHMAWPDARLGWCALLHDVGKKAAFRVIDGRMRFFGHEEIGSKMAEEILQRLKLPAKTVKSVVKAIAGHMRFSRLKEMRESKWRRALADPDFPLELELHRLDCISCHHLMENYLVMLDRIRELEERRVPPVPQPFVTGKDLLKMGLSPSPEVGKILKKLETLQLEGKLSSREEALSEAEKLISGERSPAPRP